APLIVAPVALNAALVELHGAEVLPSGLDVNGLLNVAHKFAWGPFVGRALATDVVASKRAGSSEEILRALEAAAPANPLQPSLVLWLGDQRLANNDRAGAIAAWRSAHQLDALLRRAQLSTARPALEWL